METLITSMALDERDFLRKKINDAINDLKPVDCMRIKDTKMRESDVKEMKSKAVSEYQSITDMIDRYNRINVAITQANAVTQIKLPSGRTMSRAEAIATRQALTSSENDFTGDLICQLNTSYAAALSKMNKFAEKADREVESYKQGLIQRDSSKKELTSEDLSMVKAMTDDLYGIMIDPLDVEKELKKLRDAHDSLLKEMDTALKISNATTSIEF